MSGSPQFHHKLDILLCAVAGGDMQAFTRFYDLTSARVFGLVSRVVRDRGYSEDTTQEVYARVWRSAGAYDPAAGTALAWLLTLAHRRAVDRVRKEQSATVTNTRYHALSEGPPSDVVADAAILSDERRRVADCLDSLTDSQRESLELAYYGGFTYPQVAQQLSANLATVKARIRQGLLTLRQCLGMP